MWLTCSPPPLPLLFPPRYFYPLTASVSTEIIHAHWDADIATTDDVVLVVYREEIATGVLIEFQYADAVRTYGSEHGNASPPPPPDPVYRTARMQFRVISDVLPVSVCGTS